MTRPALLTLFAAGALLAGGCSFQPAEVLLPVAGKITVQGKPLPAGRVIFAPMSPGTREGRGTVGAEGAYQVSVDGAPADKTGMPAGKYQVLVFAIKPSTPESGMKPPEWLASQRYSDAKTSNLMLEVGADGAGKYDLTLEP
jgi:hypothetical protein